jgi:hypothetical protein
LSTIYWSHLVGARLVEKHLKDVPGDTLACTALSIPVKQEQFGFSASDALSRVPAYLDTSRLHILSVCLAQLESYIKEMAYLAAARLDPRPQSHGLSPLAAKMASAILEVDSLTRCLCFAETLFETCLSPERAKIERAYKLRCATVHTGGYVTRRNVKELGIANLKLHDQIALSWPQLKEDMEAVCSLADKIDRALASTQVFEIEARRELDNLRASSALPPRMTVWSYLADEGFHLPSKRARAEIEMSVYERPNAS